MIVPLRRWSEWPVGLGGARPEVEARRRNRILSDKNFGQKLKGDVVPEESLQKKERIEGFVN